MPSSVKKTTRIRSVTSPAKKSPMRSTKRKQWSEQSMLAAIKAVQEGQPIYTSAREHGVPRTTLQDRILGKVKHGAKPGPAPYMTPEEEKETVEFLLVTSKAGYPKTRADISRKKAVKLQPTCTAVATTASNTASTSVAPQSQDPTKAPNTTPVARTTQQDYVSKYLVQYIAKPVEKTGKRVITNARVLTSDECYKILEEKEELKRKEQQEKEQRKLAREQKKRQREEQLAEKRKKKEKGNKLASRKGKGKAVPPKTSQDVDSNDSDNQEIPDEEDENTDNEDYECLECKGTWEQDIRKKNRAVWVTCTCTKWLHQKCTLQRPEDEDIDDEIFYCSDCVNDM